MTVRVKDRGYRALLTRIKAAAKTPIVLTVGVHAEEGAQPHTGSVSVARVAEINELGLGARQQAFVAPTFDEERGSHLGMLTKVASHVFDGKGAVKKAFKSEGSRLAKIMKAKAPVRTGKTRASIRAKVR